MPLCDFVSEDLSRLSSLVLSLRNFPLFPFVELVPIGVRPLVHRISGLLWKAFPVQYFARAMCGYWSFSSLGSTMF